MHKYNFEKPIFIIGAARSGTTMLGEILSMHPKVAYWLEPKYIWRYGNAGKQDDFRDSGEASEKIKEYIREKFYKFTNENSKSRFVEKTPSNVFRIDFIKEVFPEARFIYISRDGRDVSLSAERKWSSRPDKTAILRRLGSFEIPLRDMLKYIIGFIRDVPGRILFPKKAFIWGPYFKGIKEYRDKHSVIETCAKQWLESVNSAERALRNISGDRVFVIKYEEIVNEPLKRLREIFEFADLNFSLVQDRVVELVSVEKKKYGKSEEEKIKHIYPIIADKLKELNYS